MSKPSFLPGFPPQAPPHEKKSNLEDLVAQMASNTNQFITKKRTQLQSQAASIWNLEIQVGQLANSMNNHSQGALPSNTETNPKRDGKEHFKAITLRPEKELSKFVKKPSLPPKPIEGDREIEKQEKPLENMLNIGDSSPYNRPPPFPKQLQK